MTINNPFIPVPKTGVKYTEHHEHVDVDALFEQYADDQAGLKHYVTQAIRSLEQNIRGYDADMKGSERSHKAQQARITGLETELTNAQSALLQEHQDLAKTQTWCSMYQEDRDQLREQYDSLQEDWEEAQHRLEKAEEQLEEQDLIEQDEAIHLVDRLNERLDMLVHPGYQDKTDQKQIQRHIKFLRSL